ncbi:MAG: Hcp family type VI secretion system effector [Geminicoccaceae bacterium]
MATNTYIEFKEPNIKGESTDSNHKDHIEVMSWTHGFTQTTSATRASAGGGTVEMANHQDFNFTKYTDSATDDLLQYCWSGKHIKSAIFHAYRADGDNKPCKYLEINMESVIVSNISIGGGPSDLPVENVSLSYGKVTYKYIPQDEAKGTAGGVEPVSHDLIKRQVSSK